MIFGITGGTGCGKTTALQAIRELGGIIIDCDAVYHVLLQTDKKMLAAIEKRFPGTVIDGQLDRKKLGAIVFADECALADLNSITHSAVDREVRRLLGEYGGELAAVDAIALIESGMAALCDVTVAVCAPRATHLRTLPESRQSSQHVLRLDVTLMEALSTSSTTSSARTVRLRHLRKFSESLNKKYTE